MGSLLQTIRQPILGLLWRHLADSLIALSNSAIPDSKTPASLSAIPSPGLKKIKFKGLSSPLFIAEAFIPKP